MQSRSMNRLHDYVLNIIIQLMENGSYLFVLAVQSVLLEVRMDFFVAAFFNSCFFKQFVPFHRPLCYARSTLQCGKNDE